MYGRNLNSPEEKTRYINVLFTKIAPRYDLMNRILSFGLDRWWRRLAIRKARFKSGSRILDLGIGTGDMALEVLRQVTKSNIIGLDNCAELVRFGRHKSSLQSYRKRILWLWGEGNFLPFSDRSFDGVVAAFAIRNMPDLPRVFAEMYRVVRTGGKIVLLDMVEPKSYFFEKLFKFYFKYIIPRLGKCFGSHPEAYSYLYASIENFYSSDGLKHALQTLGCSDIISKDLMFHTVTICIGTK